MIVHRSTRTNRRKLFSPPAITGSRPRRYILQAAILCAAAIVAALAWHPAHSESAAAAYHAAQVASYHHRYARAEAGFTRARDLTSDPDKAAWAQYQLASCFLAQPAKRSQAMAALRQEIRDYPHHFLAARAQADLDRLEGRTPEPPAVAALDTDCGPECLQYLLRRTLHRWVSLATLRKLAGTDEHGTTLLGLQKAARAEGLNAVGMQVDEAYFRRMPQPTICWTKRSHFVAVTATPAMITPPFWSIRLYDPTGRGEKTVSPGEFSQQWDGYVLALSAHTTGAVRL